VCIDVDSEQAAAVASDAGVYYGSCTTARACLLRTVTGQYFMSAGAVLAGAGPDRRLGLSSDQTQMILLKPNSIMLAGSELVRSWFESDSVMEFGFEPAPNQLV